MSLIMPGPDVLRFRFVIAGLKQSRPALSALTSMIPGILTN